MYKKIPLVHFIQYKCIVHKIMGSRLYQFLVPKDPIDFNLLLLTINGFWPIDFKKKSLQILWSIYCFLCVFSPVSMLFIQILDLYLLRDDMFTFTKNSCATVVTFMSVAKYIIVFFKIEPLQNLHKNLKEYQNSVKHPEDVKVIEKADKLIWAAIKAMYSIALPCITAWMLYPGLESSNQKGVPFPYRLPTDDWSTPIYEVLYTYQSLSMVGFMVSILSVDLVYFGLVIRLNAKYEILIRRLKILDEIAGIDVNENEENETTAVTQAYNPIVTEKARAFVKEFTIFHQHVLGEIGQLKVIYSAAYSVHFMVAVLMVGTIIIDILVVSKGVQLQMLQRILYCAAGVFDTYLCCLFTTKMQEKSYELMRALYSTPWHALHPIVRKDLLMLIVRSKRPFALRIGNSFPLDLSLFLQFLKVTYNLTALLYQTIGRFSGTKENLLSNQNRLGIKMSFMDKIFNREDPYLIQFSLLSLVGFWFVDSEKKWVRIGYAIYKFLAIFSLLSLILIEVTDIMTDKQDTLELAERLCAATVAFIITLRIHLMLRHSEEFYQLQEKLTEFKQTKLGHPQDAELLQRVSKGIVKTSKMFFLGALLGVFFWLIHPVLYEDRKLPFPIKMPFDMVKSPNYEILYCYLTIILIMFTTCIVGTSLGFISYVVMLNSHFEVVKQKIERITEEREEVVRRERFWKEFNTGSLAHTKNQVETEKEEKRIKDAKTLEILKDAVETQNFIYDEVNRFEKLQSPLLLVHIVGIVFGVVVVETTGMSDSFTVHLVKRLLILGMGITDILLICNFGEHLQNKSCEIAEALYVTPWDEMDVKIRKVIILMSLRVRRPCVLKAGNTIRINLATYLNILRVGYNFMLLLRHSVRNP